MLWSKSLLSDEHDNFHTNHLLSMICNRSDDALASGLMVELSDHDKTSKLVLTRDRCEVRNHSWSFESVRGTHGVSASGKFAYEVTLLSTKIIQMGWATRECAFRPEHSLGVGDDIHSFAYDGSRQKKWHMGDGVGGEVGTMILLLFSLTSLSHTHKTDYGRLWKINDRIGVCIGNIVACVMTLRLTAIHIIVNTDLDERTITFYHNGSSMGIAFTDIPVGEGVEYFPAMSLDTGAACRVSFGYVCEYCYKRTDVSLICFSNRQITGLDYKPIPRALHDAQKAFALISYASAGGKVDHVLAPPSLNQPSLYYEIQFKPCFWTQEQGPPLFGFTSPAEDEAFLVELGKSEAHFVHVRCSIDEILRRAAESSLKDVAALTSILGVVAIECDDEAPFWCGLGFAADGHAYLRINGRVAGKGRLVDDKRSIRCANTIPYADIVVSAAGELSVPIALNMPRTVMSFSTYHGPDDDVDREQRDECKFKMAKSLKSRSLDAWMLGGV